MCFTIPLLAAKIKAEAPSLFFAFMFAPFSMRISTIFSNPMEKNEQQIAKQIYQINQKKFIPFFAAIINAEFPSLFTALISAPSSISIFVMISEPVIHKNGVLSLELDLSI